MTYTPPMLCNACICCYQGCDFDNIGTAFLTLQYYPLPLNLQSLSSLFLFLITVLCCKGSSECLCCAQDACCAIGEDSLGVGMVTNILNKEICALGLFCCRCAIKKPEVLCAGVAQTCCMVQGQSLPFDDTFVGKPVCALYCLSCLPEFGCCKPAPYSSKLESLSASIKSPVSFPIKR